jgi:hypothetical protein
MKRLSMNIKDSNLIKSSFFFTNKTVNKVHEKVLVSFSLNKLRNYKFNKTLKLVHVVRVYNIKKVCFRANYCIRKITI